MDINSINTAFASTNLIYQGVKAAIGVKDFIKAGAELAKLHDAWLSTQRIAIEQSITLSKLIKENAELKQELLEMSDAITQRASYEPFETAPDVWVYRSKVVIISGEQVSEHVDQPFHFACPSCMDDRGKRIILQRVLRDRLTCTACRTSYWFRDK